MTAAPVTAHPPLSHPTPAWNLRWLTPARCRIILVLVLLLDSIGHVHYLNHNCPADLSGDEAQYWDWSRDLDWSYYSKGPLVACIIRGSCAIFGDTMQGVRYPAVAFGAATSLIVYLLTRRLFGSDRLALGAVLLNHIVPMFVAGSILMTIDPPMFFCWSLATYLAAGALFEEKWWDWPLVGFAIGLGFLAKYAAMLWFVGLLIFMLSDRESRARLRSPGVWVALLIALAMMTPVIVWNHQHGWASLRHVAHQTGATAGALKRGNFFEFVGSQVGVVGPVLAVMMLLAIVGAVRDRNDPFRRKLIFLAAIGVTFWLMVMSISFFTKVQVNWPAPAYFTLMILAAYFIAMRLHARETWRPWRMWFWGTVALGLITIPIAHDSARLFPFIRFANSTFHTKINPANADLIGRLRGWQMLGEHVSRELETLDESPFVLCDDYMQTAETAFYVKGQPKTYYAGSYYTDAKRFTQYDMWPDRRLDQPNLIGRNAVYVGKGGPMPVDIAKAFDRIEQLPELPVIVRGVTVKTFKTWRCYAFKGMSRGGGRGDY